MFAFGALGDGHVRIELGAGLMLRQHAGIGQLRGDRPVLLALDNGNDGLFALAGAAATHDQGTRSQPHACEKQDHQGNTVRK